MESGLNALYSAIAIELQCRDRPMISQVVLFHPPSQEKQLQVPQKLRDKQVPKVTAKSLSLIHFGSSQLSNHPTNHHLPHRRNRISSPIPHHRKSFPYSTPPPSSPPHTHQFNSQLLQRNPPSNFPLSRNNSSPPKPCGLYVSSPTSAP